MEQPTSRAAGYRKLFLLSAISFLSAEIAIRLLAPVLGSDLGDPPAARKSPFLCEASVGYEFKPFGTVFPIQKGREGAPEQLNSDGFRGPEYSIPKGEGTFRILILGDSVVGALSVPYAETWGVQLEKKLRRLSKDAQPAGSYREYEVINGGIGGYVSWQVLERFRRRGLKYQPDLLLVFVGWNDLVFSSRPDWRRGMDLSKIEEAYAASSAPPQNIGARTRQFFYRISYVARLIRQVRNTLWNNQRVRDLIQKRQRDSGWPFNEEALACYRYNLESIRQAAQQQGVRVGIVSWPNLLSPELLRHPEVHRRLITLYSGLPLSTREYWTWYVRYQEVQRDFARAHPGVLWINASEKFSAMEEREKLAAFVDMAHLTAEGNQILAETVLEALLNSGILG